MTTMPCPHCAGRPGSLHDHVRDTGALTECPPDACPVLFAARNRRHPIAGTDITTLAR